jgi:hypothetical protein
LAGSKGFDDMTVGLPPIIGYKEAGAYDRVNDQKQQLRHDSIGLCRALGHGISSLCDDPCSGDWEPTSALTEAVRTQARSAETSEAVPHATIDEGACPLVPSGH